MIFSMSPRAQSFFSQHGGTIISTSLTAILVLGSAMYNCGMLSEGLKNQVAQISEVKADQSETKKIVTETRIDVAFLKGRITPSQTPSPTPQTSIAQIK